MRCGGEGWGRKGLFNARKREEIVAGGKEEEGGGGGGGVRGKEKESFMSVQALQLVSESQHRFSQQPIRC